MTHLTPAQFHALCWLPVGGNWRERVRQDFTKPPGPAILGKLAALGLAEASTEVRNIWRATPAGIALRAALDAAK